MQDGFVPVWAGDNGRDLIGQVMKFNRRTGKLTIEITDPEFLDALDAGQRVGLGLTMREVPRHDGKPGHEADA